MANPHFEPFLADVAARQHGVFTRAQAHAAAVGDATLRSALRRGRLHRTAAASVFIANGAPPGWRRELTVAALVRPGGCAWGATAAGLHGIDGFVGEGPMEVNVGPNEKLSLPGVIVTRRRCEAVERTVRDGIPCSTIERTVCELAGRLGPHELDDVVRWAEQAGVSAPMLEEAACATRRSGQRSSGVLLATLRQRAQWSQRWQLWASALGELCVAAGLPAPRTGHSVPAHGDRWFGAAINVPLAFIGERVAVQPIRRHGGPDAGLGLSREHALLAAGWLLIWVDQRLPPVRQFPAIERAVRDRRGRSQRRRSLAS